MNDGRVTPEEEEYEEEEEEEEGENEVRNDDCLAHYQLNFWIHNINKFKYFSTWMRRQWNSLRTGFSTRGLPRSKISFRFLKFCNPSN